MLITEASSIPAEMINDLRHRYEADQVEWVPLVDLPEALKACPAKNPTHLVLLSCVLQHSEPAQKSLQSQVENFRSANPGITLLLAPELGSTSRLVDILQDRIDQALLEGNLEVPIIRIDGLLDSPRSFSYGDIESLPNPIADVGEVVSGRHGKGVWVRTLLENLAPRTEATHAVFHSSDDNFSASADLPTVLQRALFVYSQDGHPLSSTQGGPMRLLVPEINNLCANVKGVIRLEIITE